MNTEIITKTDETGADQEIVRPVLPSDYGDSQIRLIPHTPLAAANYYDIRALQDRLDAQQSTIENLKKRIELLEGKA